MFISSLDVENAVLGIFFDLRIPTGGRLGYAALVKIWPKTHLRHSDLYHAVQRLVRLHELQLEDTPEGQSVLLTGPGHAHAAELNRTRLAALLRHVRLSLLPIARRFDHRTDPGPRRRIADRIAPQI